MLSNQSTLRTTLLIFAFFASSPAHAITLRAFSTVHIPTLSPASIVGVLSSTSIVTDGRGRRLAIEAKH